MGFSVGTIEFNLRSLEFGRRYEVKEEGRNRLEEESKRCASEKMEEIYKTKIHEKITILEDCYSLKYEHRPLYRSGERRPQSPKPPVSR